MVISGLASGRLSIQVGAIETRSLPSSLAAARRGFTFYLADPPGSIDLNRQGGSGEPPLPFPQCRAYCANDSIAQRISQGGSAPSISLRFAVSSEEEISFVMKEPRKSFLIRRGFITNALVGYMDLLLLMPDHLHALIAIDGRDSPS